LKIEGVVVKKDPENHQRVYYSYKITERIYFGAGRAGFGNPTFHDLAIGDNVIVFYDPLFPENSVLGNPYELLRNELISVLLVVIIFPLVVLYALSKIGVMPMHRSTRAMSNQL
jgi:hypothetical protein